VLTSANMGDSRGDSQVGDDCPRRTLPTRDICEDNARLRDFRGDIGSGSSWDWDPSRMAIASEDCVTIICTGRGEETLKPENKDCRGDTGLTCGMLEFDG
jgi:hypothetical protein